ncbi:30S ribosomal protein S6 [Candidatus Nomurabacteria bacterium]|nr:30S ribosomal protein S6 [Candidatus Nomurabacteria bacterium]
MDAEERKEKSKVYELGLLIVPSISEENLPKSFSAIKEILEKAGSTFISEDLPKIRPLAYTMSQVSAGKRTKFNTAYFGWVKFEMESDVVPEVKAKLDLNKEILRFIIIKTVKENTLFGHKLQVVSRRGETIQTPKKEVVKEDAEKMTTEELDKTIEELVV